ncbi:PglD-related sugar-binding protein [Agriterribacter humi]|jgi:sugar O-acyltransferase (sialic acid O-acetyltransferase NeuD family)|uniref:PglD-related sugar-binding protein n=1 Tax=Agriterribacter humi TaxID=1104781 RepID=UPI00126535CE|nr:serine acetyltransferase [Agriterribacter humi]
MRKIAIAGAGGFSKEIYLTINDINKIEDKWEFIGFFDDNVPKGKLFMDFQVLGNMNDLNHIDETIDVIVAAGKSYNIISILKKLHSDKLDFPNLFHPSCQFLHFESLSIGIGNIIQPYSSLSADNKIGNYNVFNAGVRIGHDTIIGNYNTFATATLISGGVEVGDQNDFGMNSGILQYKKVGSRNVIAPMSILFKSIKDDGHYLGVPAMSTGV